MNTLHLKLMLRNLKRNRLHSSINIAGFSVGIAVFLMIMLHVNHQFSFDKFHSSQNSIYKIFLGKSGGIPAPVINQIKNQYPDIEDATRLTNWYGGGEEGYFILETNTFKVTDLLFAERNFFDFFDFSLTYGNGALALEQPNSIILTESQAQKIYGDTDPVGKQLIYKSNTPNIEYNLTVNGVIEDTPSNSSIKYNGVISMSTILANNIKGGRMENDWGNWGFETFVKTKNVEKLNKELTDFWAGFIKEKWKVEENTQRGKEYQLSFVPLKSLHFHGNSRSSFLYVILFIGFLILTIAIINYVNLSISIFSSRVKEIGLKKVIGSDRSSLFWLFINESVLITFISSVLAVLLIFMLHPLYSKITGLGEIIASRQLIPEILLFLCGILVIGIISGIYPALYLTSLKPINAIQNKIQKGTKKAGLKYTLIVFQFVVSISLIVSVFVISGQIKFMQTSELGYDYKQVIYLKGSGNIDKHYDSFKQTLLKNPNILSVSRTNTHMGRELNITSKHKVNGEYKTYYATTIDPDFIKTMGIQLISGRNLSWELQSDKNAVLVNEKFVNEFELEQPVENEIEFLDAKVKVIGVIKDFHNNSLHYEIKPCIYCNLPWNSCVNVRLNTQNLENTLASIKGIWQEFSPEVPFDYQFLDKTYEELYKSEKEFSTLIKAFSILAICIACLGLFGLVSYMANQRRKEIGIRKINGAKVSEILTMLNCDFIKWVVIAFIAALPISYFTMQKWLENFAYKTSLSWWIFALAGVLTLGIALLTVSWQSWRAATRNPVEVLRYE